MNDKNPDIQGMDFNDVHKSYGVDAVKSLIAR